MKNTPQKPTKIELDAKIKDLETKIRQDTTLLEYKKSLRKIHFGDEIDYDLGAPIKSTTNSIENLIG